jgi:small-conductance mechanosensitive channel
MSALDVLVLIPVIPLVLILASWTLPWESWIPWDRIPKAVLGPYLLYAAFASWYFEFDRWLIPMAVVAGVAISVWAVVEKIRSPKQDQLKRESQQQINEHS